MATIMTLCVDSKYGYAEWDYHWGTVDDSIAQKRYAYLQGLNVVGDDLVLAFRDAEKDVWTKWLTWWKTDREKILNAYDVHRSFLWNEIVVESDYPNYEQNCEAARILGAILQDKGLSPLYYYSGSKSIHIHIFIDFNSLAYVSPHLQDVIVSKYTKDKFIKAFMTWLRAKISRYWDLGTRAADLQVADSKKHLIRAELSMNKLGYKTFLGYNYKDISPIPYICNAGTKLYPKIGEVKLSRFNNPDEVLEEFLHAEDVGARKSKVKHKSKSLFNYFNASDIPEGEIKGCVQFILSDSFKATGDGYRRALFILSNELGKLMGQESALLKILEWNSRMGEPLRDGDLQYHVNRGVYYTLTHEYIHQYLTSLGFEEGNFCNSKVYI